MIILVVRGAMGNLAKANRMLLIRPPNKQHSEISIEQGSERLSLAATEVFEATEKFLKTCQDIRDIDFLNNLKL